MICLNLGLLAGLAYVWKQRSAVAHRSQLAVRQEVAAPATGTKFLTRTIHSTGAGGQPTPEKFTWRLQLAMQESARIRSQQDLPREERDALLQQMQAELDSSMGKLLGPQVLHALSTELRRPANLR